MGARDITGVSRLKALAAAAVLAIGAATSAQAVTFSAVDAPNSWSVDFSKEVTDATLSAATTWTFTGHSSDAAHDFWDFTLQVTNTSVGTGANLITAIGFATNPNADVNSYSSTSGDWEVFPTTQSGQNFPGFQNVELCVFNRNNCSGG